MNNGNKIILLSFASDDLKKSIYRFKKQAKETNFYDEIRVMSFTDLDTDFKKVLKTCIKLKEKRFRILYVETIFIKKNTRRD